MANKKIKNTNKKQYNGIQFKSQLEVMAYKTLLQEGFAVIYEEKPYILWEGFKPTIPFYDQNKHTKLLELNNQVFQLTSSRHIRHQANLYFL